MPKSMSDLKLSSGRTSSLTMAVSVHQTTYREYLIRSFNGRYEDHSEVEILHLYEVTRDGQTIMVIAESEEGAISQASCYPRSPIEGRSLSYEEQEERRNRSTARQVPLILRGWGGTEF